MRCLGANCTLLLELDTLSEDSYKDSTLIMQLLRDNLVCADCLLLGLANVLTRPFRLFGPHRRLSRPRGSPPPRTPRLPRQRPELPPPLLRRNLSPPSKQQPHCSPIHCNVIVPGCGGVGKRRTWCHRSADLLRCLVCMLRH